MSEKILEFGDNCDDKVNDFSEGKYFCVNGFMRLGETDFKYVTHCKQSICPKCYKNLNKIEVK